MIALSVVIPIIVPVGPVVSGGGSDSPMTHGDSILVGVAFLFIALLMILALLMVTDLMQPIAGAMTWLIASITWLLLGGAAAASIVLGVVGLCGGLATS